MIHPSQAAQITALKWDKAPTKILAKYSDYADIFSSELAMELSENTGMNEHAIKLIDKKQPPYGLIYAFSPMELETLKAYIKLTSELGLSDLLSLLQLPPSFLTKSLTVASVYVEIIKA